MSIMSILLILLFIAVLVLLVKSSRNAAQEKARSEEEALMTAERALRLAESWAKHAGASLEDLGREADGSFHGHIGAAYLEYIARRSELVVRGLVYLEGDQFDALLLDKLQRLGDATTLGGGRFEVDSASQNHGKTPSLNLRRDFSDGALRPAAFVKAVEQLMAASVAWRKQALYKALTEVG